MWANNIKPYPIGLFHGYLNVPPVSCRHLDELIARSGVVSRERERERENGLGSVSLSLPCSFVRLQCKFLVTYLTALAKLEKSDC